MLSKEVKDIYQTHYNKENSLFNDQLNANYNILISKIKEGAKNLCNKYNITEMEISTNINYIFRERVISEIKNKLISDGFTCNSMKNDSKYCLSVEW